MGSIQDGVSGLGFNGLRFIGFGLIGSRGAEELSLNPLKLVDTFKRFGVEPLDEGRLVVAVVRPQVVGGVRGANEASPEAVVDGGEWLSAAWGLPDHNIGGLGQEVFGEGGGVGRLRMWSFLRPSICSIIEELEVLIASAAGEE